MDAHNTCLFPSVRSLAQKNKKNKHTHTNKFNKEADNPKTFAAVAITKWQP